MVPSYLGFAMLLIPLGIFLLLVALGKAVSWAMGTREEAQPKHIFPLIFLGVISLVIGLSPWMF